MERMEQLASNQATLMEQASPDDFTNWKAHPLTKALLLKLEADSEEVRDLWSRGHFPDDTQLKAQGQAMYIMNLIEDIKAFNVERDATDD